MSVEEKLDELIEISRYYGTNPDFLLEGGGNTSFKDSYHLYIKASGVALSTIDKSGFVKMTRPELQKIWQREYPDNPGERETLFQKDLRRAVAEIDDICLKRPSVETLLHEAIPYPFVVHTHPAIINGLTCSKDGERISRELFGDSVLWIPIVNPGYTLAITVKKHIERYHKTHGKNPRILLLQNHGLFVAGETTEEIKSTTEKLVKEIEKRLERDPDFSKTELSEKEKENIVKIAPVIRMTVMKKLGEQKIASGNSGDKKSYDKAPTSKKSIVTFATNSEIARIVSSRENFSKFRMDLTPDHLVYAGSKPLFLNNTEEEIEWAIENYTEEEKTIPKIIAIEKLGIFACGESKRDTEAALNLFMDALRINIYAESFGGVNPLPQEQIEFITNWESESYRKRVTLGKSEESNKLAERIAIVTGSAQGIGMGIAEGLLREGCNVVIADLNLEHARETAKEFCNKFGRGKAKAIGVNVADENSVRELVISTVLEYGGIDILVSNAGVLKAGGLDTMDIESFDFVTKVNYYGYFICTKHVSEIMKTQNRLYREYSMDIIQINSKSGLSGSKRNFAYAGGKFGGIGLTQSFALELVENNIKVNSICPGNYFDGPLWSDPEKGLFIQYLRANKVPGAKTVEDVRKFYESKVPMLRGVRIEDINRAVKYVIEQEYETGQAVPVTGGQIMLK